jgi:hypothetical protein
MRFSAPTELPSVDLPRAEPAKSAIIGISHAHDGRSGCVSPPLSLGDGDGVRIVSRRSVVGSGASHDTLRRSSITPPHGQATGSTGLHVIDVTQLS